MSESPAGVVIGDLRDRHTSAVVNHLGVSFRPLVVDVVRLAECRYLMHEARLTIADDDHVVEVASGAGIRGWIRRLAPADWQRGVVVESHDAAVKTAWLALLTGVLRTCGVEWLTGVDELVAADNKLVQYAAAARLGARVPPTVVTNDAAAARDVIGRDIVVKSLGPGHFFDADRPYALFAAELDAEAPDLQLLAHAPFLVQARIVARSHLRVVTVRDEVWAAELGAAGRPVDWRADPAVHQSFKAIDHPPDGIATWALAVAAGLHLGYTSQDWVLSNDGPYLVDVNPAGQWLFLPPAVADPVTAAIAAWLKGAAL